MEGVARIASWFCDMDGVLVKQTGSKGFDEMPWHVNGKEIWHALTGQRATLLSKSPDDYFAMGYLEKRRWVDFHLGIAIHLICVPGPADSHKARFCLPNDVLVDDSEPVCNAWRKAGGIAILHRNLEQTLSEIMRAKRLTRNIG